MTFATLQGMRNARAKFDPAYFDYVIVDEAHHAKAETFEDVIGYFTPKFKLGLTATPDRLDGRNIRELFGEAVYSKGLAEAIARGWLADVDYHIVFDDAVKKILQGGFVPATLKELRELFSVRPRNEAIAENILEERHRIGLDEAKTIVFCENIQHAEEMAELLGGVTYHSSVDKDEKAAILHGFRGQGHQIICAVDMFNEGIDIPDARLVVFLRSTSSQTIFEQQLGRGLRRIPGKKEKVAVLDFVANIERIDMVKKLGDEMRRHARQVDQIAGDGEGLLDEEVSKAIALAIRGPHGDFEFDKLAVDLLKKWGALKETSELIELSNDELIALALKLKPTGPLFFDEIVALCKTKQFIGTKAIKNRFGSLAAFHEACGFSSKKALFDMSNDELVVVALKLKPGGPLKFTEIEAFSKSRLFISVTTIKSRFGSMTAFHEACGFKTQTLADLPNDELIALAKKLKATGPLSQADIDAFSREGKFVSTPTVQNRFGSLAAFHEACGFSSKKALFDMSNDELVALALKLKPNGPLIHTEVDELSKDRLFVSTPTIQKRFGSWEAFREACGFPVEKSLADLPNDELVALALRLKPTGPLTHEEVREFSRNRQFVASPTLKRRFGSWKAFQEACRQATAATAADA